MTLITMERLCFWDHLCGTNVLNGGHYITCLNKPIMISMTFSASFFITTTLQYNKRTYTLDSSLGELQV